MTDACDHEDCHAPHGSGSLGIPQVGAFDPAAFERAVNGRSHRCRS
ncbi:MAG TPA: GTP cyclohydrolase I FolE, partial [Nitrospira sp.]|nr:GTP cyclohydrolase I FolE [Nitrospira sp.]